MPSRILKESITTSDTLAQISADAERLFWRLVVLADDYGLYDGRPMTVMGKGFTAFLGAVRLKDVMAWMDELEGVRLIRRYTVDGKPYLQITTWDRHQQTRAKKSKYPQPNVIDYPGGVSTKGRGTSASDSAQLLASEINSHQMPTTPIKADLVSSDTARQPLLASDYIGNQMLAHVPVSENVSVSESENVSEGDRANAQPTPDAVLEVFEYYRTKVQPNARLIDSARQKIKTRLKTFSVAQLKEGVDRFAADWWRMENNSREGAAWFFHSDERSEKFLNLEPRASPNGRLAAPDARDSVTAPLARFDELGLPEA